MFILGVSKLSLTEQSSRSLLPRIRLTSVIVWIQWHQGIGSQSTIANCHHNEYASSHQLPPGVVHRSFSQRPLTNLYVAHECSSWVVVIDPANGDENQTSQEPAESKQQKVALFHIETVRLDR